MRYITFLYPKGVSGKLSKCAKVSCAGRIHIRLSVDGFLGIHASKVLVESCFFKNLLELNSAMCVYGKWLLWSGGFIYPKKLEQYFYKISLFDNSYLYKVLDLFNRVYLIKPLDWTSLHGHCWSNFSGKEKM